LDPFADSILKFNQDFLKEMDNENAKNNDDKLKCEEFKDELERRQLKFKLSTSVVSFEDF